MTASANGFDSRAAPLQELVVVHVVDAINPTLAGRGEVRYESPPLLLEEARTLVRLLFGVNGHRVLPNGGHEFPHWWPLFLPAGGHESPHQQICLFPVLGEWLDPLAGGRLREPVAVLPVGDQDMSVMK